MEISDLRKADMFIAALTNSVDSEAQQLSLKRRVEDQMIDGFAANIEWATKLEEKLRLANMHQGGRCRAGVGQMGRRYGSDTRQRCGRCGQQSGQRGGIV